MTQEIAPPMQPAEYPTVPPDFGNWLAGFADGEGSFTMEKISKPQWDMRCYSCRFTVRVRNDDGGIIREIRERTGIGSVIETVPKHHSVWWNTKPSAVWAVLSRPHCLRLVEILDEYPLRAKKARDYAIWREAVLLWATVRKTGRRDPANQAVWDKMDALRAHLIATRAYAAPGEVSEVDPIARAKDLVAGEGVEAPQMSLMPTRET